MSHLVLHCPPLSPSQYRRHTPSSPPSSSSSLSLSLSSTAWSNPTSHGVRLSSRSLTVRCMAKPRRVALVAKQIRRELSDMLLTDTTLQYAILPEAALGADRYLSSLTTISDVEVSSDLQVPFSWFSVKNLSGRLFFPFLEI